MIPQEPFDIIIEGKKLPWRKVNIDGVVIGVLPKYVYVTYSAGVPTGIAARISGVWLFGDNIDEAVANVVKHIKSTCWYSRFIKNADNHNLGRGAKTGLYGISITNPTNYPNLLWGNVRVIGYVFSGRINNLKDGVAASKDEYIKSLARLYVAREYIKELINHNNVPVIGDTMTVDIDRLNIPKHFVDEKTKEALGLINLEHFQRYWDKYSRYLTDNTTIISGKRVKLVKHVINKRSVMIPKLIKVCHTSNGIRYDVVVNRTVTVFSDLDEAMYWLEYVLLENKMLSA